jgi:hypothetical protein
VTSQCSNLRDVAREFALIEASSEPLRTRHYIRGGLARRPVVVILESKSDGVFLHRYGSDGVLVGDTWHLNVDHARRQAAYEFQDAMGSWTVVPHTAPDALTFALASMTGPAGDWESYLGHLRGVTVRGGEAFLTLDAAHEATNWLETRHGVVVGMEGFRLMANAVVPSLGHIGALWNDYASWDDNVGASAVTAHRLLDDWRGEIDVVVFAVATAPSDIAGR